MHRKRVFLILTENSKFEKETEKNRSSCKYYNFKLKNLIKSFKYIYDKDEKWRTDNLIRNKGLKLSY